MAYSVVLTQGTTITFDSIPVYGVTGIKGIGSGKSDEIPTTTLLSEGKEFELGLPDFGTITLALNRSLDDPGQAAMLAANLAQEKKTVIITLPHGDLTVGTFIAGVSEITMDIEGQKVTTGEAMLRVSGTIVWS